MSDKLNFTPNEEQLRQAYWHHVYEHGVNLDRRDIDAEFTRGLEQIKAQVRAEEREQDAREPSEPVRVQIAARRGGKHSTLADMIVERANARGVRVEFVEPDREPSDAEVEAAGEAVWDKYGDAGSSTWDNALPREKAWARGTARAALLAAQQVRRG